MRLKKIAVGLFLICFTANACKHPTKKQAGTKAINDKYQLDPGFIVLDTGTYSDELIGGTYAIISHNEEVDTIDLSFGVKKLEDKFIYQKILSYTDSATPSNILPASPSSYIILDREGNKRKLGDLTSDFHDYFSSPAVIADKVYYWQMHRLDSNGLYEISAGQFNPSTSKTSRHFLFKDDIATDNMNYFPSPVLKNGIIEFSLSYKQKWKFSKDLKRIE
jgi:hypothetical protein